MTSPPLRRLRLICRGVVQGVGFRPTVHRLASAAGLGGFVRNTPVGVIIEVEGLADAVESFPARLRAALPPLARLDELVAEQLEPIGERSFSVLASQAGRRERALVPPDSALCADCRAEMEDLADRRARYPFTTCTNCGPRFTLVRSLPYDRERTSMACFPLCPECRREYQDPTNRRFHAEPVCCPACGPTLWLVRSARGTGPDGRPPARRENPAETIRTAQAALAAGEIVALKGLGGFQLACRADDERAVARLRERKRRPTKPFALMVRDLASAHALVALEPADETALTTPNAPAVLAPRRSDTAVAANVAPGLGDLGVLLPTTPLHVELFRNARFEALVMTSGNASDEPIACGNREALDRLSGIADLFLLHNRDVVRRADDSVVRSGRGGPAMIRRARGYVPQALALPEPTPEAVLALGPYLQATACLAVGDQAFVSQHVGDLDGEPARAFLAEVVEQLEEFLETRGRLIVVDQHPDYPSTWLGERLARERGAELLAVQHHLAHAAATLAEHGRFPARGEHTAALALDGTGWGPDGSAWGGEWLLLGGDLGWRRLAALEPLPLVGGEAAVHAPWRVAVAALARHGAADLLERLPLARAVEQATLATVADLASGGSWPLASGAGRVFEAAGALLGLATINGYEGEAAARLEAAAATAWPHASWPEVRLPAASTDVVLPSSALLVAAARRVIASQPLEQVAAGFHATFCHLAVELTRRALPADIEVVGLGGGCLVNRLLRDGLEDGLSAAGYTVFSPRALPPGDGGLSFGQAVLGAVALARGAQPRQEGG
jgi:hydrogenase maturation protein HypF